MPAAVSTGCTAELRVRGQARDIVEAAEGDARLAQRRRERVHVVAGEDRDDQRVHLRLVLEPRRVAGEARVGRERRIAQDVPRRSAPTRARSGSRSPSARRSPPG